MSKDKIINFQPFRKQYECLSYLMDDTSTEILYGGAGNGGKSWIGSTWLLLMCQKYPGSRWLMGRSKLATLKETTLKTFFKVCKHFKFIADVDYFYNASSHIIKFPNGSEVLLKDLFHYPSDREYDSLGSLEIAGAFLDEISQISLKAREVVKSRLGWKMEDGTEIKPKILYTCNPSKNWSYKDFYLPWRNNELPSTRKFIQALSDDNIFSSEGRSESLHNLTGNERKRLLLGDWEFDGDPSSLIEYDNILNIFNNTHIIELDKEFKVIGTRRKDASIINKKYISWDIAGGGKDLAVILVWHGLSVIEYKTIQTDDGTKQVEYIKDMQKKHNIPNFNIVFDNDGIGGMAGMHFKGAVNFSNGGSPLNKENYVNIKSQMYYKLAEVINNNELYFETDDEDIKIRITQELEQVKRKNIDKDGKLAIIGKDIIRDKIGRSPDISDSMMLRMYFLIHNNTPNFKEVYYI